MILKPLKSEFNKDFHDRIWKAKNYVREHYEDLKKLSIGQHKLDKEICEKHSIIDGNLKSTESLRMLKEKITVKKRAVDYRPFLYGE